MDDIVDAGEDVIDTATDLVTDGTGLVGDALSDAYNAAEDKAFGGLNVRKHGIKIMGKPICLGQQYDLSKDVQYSWD